MNIIYFGNGIRGVRCLSVLCEAGFESKAVVVHHSASAEPSPTSVRYEAIRRKLQVMDPKNVNSENFLRDLRRLDSDLFVLVGYTQILKKGILSLPAKGCINLHGGQMPHYRGGSPVNWQIINGETMGGCAVLYVDEGIDTGPILAQELYDIGPDETADEVVQKTLEIFPRLLLKVMRNLEKGEVQAVPQNPNEGKYYCKRYPQDGQIFWSSMTEQEVHNLVRGLSGPGLPGAYTFFGHQKVVIWKTERLRDQILGPAGRIALKRQNGVVVICRDRGILVKSIKVAAEREIDPSNFLKLGGYSLSARLACRREDVSQ